MRRPVEWDMRRSSAAPPCQGGVSLGIIAEDAATATRRILLCTPYMYAPPLSGGGMSAIRKGHAFNPNSGASVNCSPMGRPPGVRPRHYARTIGRDIATVAAGRSDMKLSRSNGMNRPRSTEATQSIADPHTSPRYRRAYRL